MHLHLHLHLNMHLHRHLHRHLHLQEGELEQWVEEHPEYSASQLRAVATAVTSNNSKAKQKINSLISDLSTRIRR